MSAPAAPSTERSALTAGVICYTLWGFLPLLFNAAEHSGAGVFEIVAWRTIWSVPLAALLVFLADRGAGLRMLLATPKIIAALFLSAILIGINWSTYVWAVDNGHTLSASLGYYINPLLNMAVGALLFRERIDRLGIVAIVLAAIGVLIQGLALGEFPWISLILAFSFCGYGVVRKQAAVTAQTGLLVECLFLVIPAMIYAAMMAHSGQGVFGRNGAATVLLIFCGPATVVPLALFAFAARRLPLTIVGFLQFIAPTLQFGCGLFAGEVLTPARGLSFVFIWAGVAVFALGAWLRMRKPAPAVMEAGV